MDERSRVIAAEGVTATTALVGAQVFGVVGRQQRPGVTRVPLLAAARPLTLGLGGPTFDIRAIRGRRAGRMGRVEAQAFPEGSDLSVESVQTPLLLLESQKQRGLDSRWDLVPKITGDRRRERHILILHNKTMRWFDP